MDSWLTKKPGSKKSKAKKTATKKAATKKVATKKVVKKAATKKAVKKSTKDSWLTKKSGTKKTRAKNPVFKKVNSAKKTNKISTGNSPLLAYEEDQIVILERLIKVREEVKLKISGCEEDLRYFGKPILFDTVRSLRQMTKERILILSYQYHILNYIIDGGDADWDYLGRPGTGMPNF